MSEILNPKDDELTIWVDMLLNSCEGKKNKSVIFNELRRIISKKPIKNIDKEIVIHKLREAWSFDNNQCHTHTWHDREDFIEWFNRNVGNNDGKKV